MLLIAYRPMVPCAICDKPYAIRDYARKRANVVLSVNARKTQ